MPEDYVERIEKEIEKGCPSYASLQKFQLFVGKAPVFAEWQYEGEPQKVIVRIRRAGMMPLEFLGVISEESIILDTIRKNDLLYGKKEDLWYG